MPDAANTILHLTTITDPERVQEAAWMDALIGSVACLIEQDFNRLIQILYRLDVDEGKIRNALATHPGTDAASLIARLLWERQLQKIAMRSHFKATPPPDGDDASAW